MVVANAEGLTSHEIVIMSSFIIPQHNMALHNTTEKVVQTTTAASRTAKQVLAKDPKLGPLLMLVAGTGEKQPVCHVESNSQPCPTCTVGAAMSVSFANFNRAKTRTRNMRKDIVSDATVEQTAEALAEARDEFIRSVIYMPGYETCHVNIGVFLSCHSGLQLR
jgi:hypothetical protein